VRENENTFLPSQGYLILAETANGYSWWTGYAHEQDIDMISEYFPRRSLLITKEKY
jgi:hypothetical protein